MKEKTIFFALMRDVYYLIPENYLNLFWKQYPDERLTLVKNVREGRTHNVDILIKIIETSVPGYEVPVDYLSYKVQPVAA